MGEGFIQLSRNYRLKLPPNAYNHSLLVEKKKRGGTMERRIMWLITLVFLFFFIKYSIKWINANSPSKSPE